MRHNAPARAVISAAVIGIHLIGVLALMRVELRGSRESPEPLFVSFWPSTRIEPEPIVPPMRAKRSDRAARSAPHPSEPPAQRASEQIVSAEPSESVGSVSAPIDWQGEIAAVARTHGEPRSRATFSDQPSDLRKPCSVEHWEWKPEEKKVGLAPLPYVVLGRCVLGLGFFGCGFGEPAEIDTQGLTAALMDGPEASVPDANACD